MLVACLLWFPLALPARSQAVTLPAGFDQQLLAAAIGFPTGMAFTPDGRLLMTVQTGQLRVYENGALSRPPRRPEQVGASPDPDIERGLEKGVAVGPDFADTHYIYLYYTYKGGTSCRH